MATRSAYLDRLAGELWSQPSFSFIPDWDVAPAQGAARRGDGPRIAFAGFPSHYSVAFLLALLGLDVELAGIVTSPGAHPAILGDNALSRIAGHLDVPLLLAWRINDEHSRMHLQALQADAIVMASFDQIIGNRALALPKHGWLNIHPSLIPQYRGPEPVYWALAEGARTTGITLHRAAPRVDSGGILAQAEVRIDAGDTAGTLTRRLVAAGVELLPGAMRRLLDDDPGELPDMSRATYRGSVGHRPLVSAAGVDEAERMVRAGVPNMPAWAHIDGGDRYVLAARAHHAVGSRHDHSLQFPDGSLEVLATSERCGCHHDTPDCPHRMQPVAGV